MLEEQERQGNEPNVKVFQKDRFTNRDKGGFLWGRSKEDFRFFHMAVLNQIVLLYDRYPLLT